MLVSLSMFPTDKGESVSSEVAKIIDIIDRSGLSYKLSAMATVIEGEWEDIMNLINECRLKLHETSNRVYIVMTVDDRKDASGRLDGKVRSLKDKLGRDVKS